MDSAMLRDLLWSLARNHSWAWSPVARHMWSSIDGVAFRRHPVQIVSDISEDRYDTLLADNEFMTTLTTQTEMLQAALEDSDALPQIAYFSAEFGMSEVINQYAGGLGILAGDHLKTASDLNIPLVGVGLFYREGFFSQRVEAGRQSERYDTVDPESLGVVDTGIVIDVPMPRRNVAARVWQMAVGRISLLLLDTAVPTNDEADRSITDRLYSGNQHHRLEQEMILGVGGARALSALGLNVSLHHLNEGHAGFLTFELIDRIIVDGDLDLAVDKIRDGLVFTTHTPVPAGIDRFERTLIEPFLRIWASRWGIDTRAMWALGAEPRNPDRFNMAALSLRTSSAANGVSQLHGSVSRDLFSGIGVGDDIISITNGVHARTWVAPHCQIIFDDALGPTWSEGDPDAWRRVERLDDTTITALRRTGSVHLGELMGEHLGESIDPDALVVGFARRFAPYKRPTLLFEHLGRLEAVLADDDRPVHFVFAGKAHPADRIGQDLIARILAFSASGSANGRFSFIPDYDMRIARSMYEGCDIWLNTPVRPREASGTSGEKATLNGGLNCSILDGWWAEMYDETYGWAIPASGNPDAQVRDLEESAATLDILDGVIDEYYARPEEFTGRVRRSWANLGPRVVAARMVREYQNRLYGPALERSRRNVTASNRRVDGDRT